MKTTYKGVEIDLNEATGQFTASPKDRRGESWDWAGIVTHIDRVLRAFTPFRPVEGVKIGYSGRVEKVTIDSACEDGTLIGSDGRGIYNEHVFHPDEAVLAELALANLEYSNASRKHTIAVDKAKNALRRVTRQDVLVNPEPKEGS